MEKNRHSDTGYPLAHQISQGEQAKMAESPEQNTFFPETEAEGRASFRRRYSDEALRFLPKLFALVDRNPYSATYGSFDRAYWHYRTMDFPCGMAQEFCLPLALVYHHPFPDNPWHGVERVRQLALAGVDFAARSAHRDGSCDDYFPFEQALGAAVFSLYATSETCLILGDADPARVEFLARRATWLLHNQETGQLTNHQAFAALALYNVYLITRDSRFEQGAREHVELCRRWQHPEGWFQEYEGADPGYHSCTIDFLAKLWKKSGDDTIPKMLEPAVEFAWYFMHPDGSYAGEYGSRNTYHFYPHGFELLAPRFEKAGQIADHFLRTLPRGKRYFNDDDRMCAHYLYNWLQAYLDYHPHRPQPITARKPFRKYFPGAQLLIVHTPHYYAVANLSKGGVLKILDAEKALASDTGLIARTEDERVIVSHRVDDQNTIEVDEALQTARVAGAMCLRKKMLPTPFRQILFRILNLTLGRHAPNLLRAMLQKKLIVGKPRTAYRYERRIEFREDAVTITDRLLRPNAESRLRSVHAGSDATSIYVANSNVYQQSVLLPWHDLGAEFLRGVNEKGEASSVRVLDFSARTTTSSGE